MTSLLTGNIEKKVWGSRTIISNKSLDIGDSKTVGLLGRSGLGKSTFLRMLAGLDVDFEGNVTTREATATGTPKAVQYLHQEATIFPWMTVRENILAFAPEDNAWQSDPALNTLKLNTLLDRFPMSLSGGEKQALALFRALSCKPKVLLLDEPFHSCDTGLRRAMREALIERKKNGMAMALVTHEPDEAVMLCDSIHILKGDVISDDSTLIIEIPDDLPRHRDDSAFKAKVLECFTALEFNNTEQGGAGQPATRSELK